MIPPRTLYNRRVGYFRHVSEILDSIFLPTGPRLAPNAQRKNGRDNLPEVPSPPPPTNPARGVDCGAR